MQPTLNTTDMRYWRVAPDPRLRELVQCYWMVEDAPERTAAPRVQHGEDLLLPDGYSEIVFNRGATGFERWPLGARERAEHMRGSYIIGGRAHSVGTLTSEPLRLAGVKLASRFLRELIGVPLHAFRNDTLSLRDLQSAAMLELEDRVAAAASVPAITRLFDEFLLGAQRRTRPDASATDALLRRIHRDRGTTPIMHWARSAGVNARSLERAFCASTGMTPKQYARVIRFKRAYHTLLGPALRPLAAALDGFYDQSHFNREFRYFTGMAPTARLAKGSRHATHVTDHLLDAELSADSRSRFHI